jgi:hypothetical protein
MTDNIHSYKNFQQDREKTLNSETDSRIFRHRQASQYTTFPNSFTKNFNITHEGRSFLLYVLSLPETWEISSLIISKEMKLGINKTLSMFKHLISLGYMKKIQRFSGNLKSKIDYLVTDTAWDFGGFSNNFSDTMILEASKIIGQTKERMYKKKKTTKKVVVFSSFQEFSQTFKEIHANEAILQKAWEVYAAKLSSGEVISAPLRWIRGVIENLVKEDSQKKEMEEVLKKRKEWALSKLEGQFYARKDSKTFIIEEDGFHIIPDGEEKPKVHKWIDNKFWKIYGL